METISNNNNNNSTSKPILPQSGKRNVLVTSALPYVNNVPHLGNIVGCVLSADVYARYLRLRGTNVIYICGTDEYGTATEAKAVQEGLSPQEICDKYHKIHSEVYEWFQIKFDKFGRTSTEAQTKIAQDIFLRLYEKDLLKEATIEQLFCEQCNKFLADRFVEGTCNFCKFPDARGDQCDNCGKLINAIELINPVCKLDGTKPVIRSTKHLNLDLPTLTARLSKFLDDSIATGIWSDNAVQITRAWLKGGLEQRCITRDLKWGIPVPLEDFKNKVFYVWFDAPIGYISITASYTDEWEKWWKNPKEVELVQFMGKDNIPFHTVIFPSCLLGSGYDWTLLKSISTTEYLNYEGGKFSKSRGTGVFGVDVKTSGVPSEVWRYYLLSNRPETADSSFAWDDFMTKNNSELLGNLGNFFHRALSFCKATFEGKVPACFPNDSDKKYIESTSKELADYIAALDKIHIKDGLKIAMSISKSGNQYLQENKHWELKEKDKVRCGTVIAFALNLTKLLAILIEPYMPAISENIFSQLNFRQTHIPDTFVLDLPIGHPIGDPAVVFKKLEPNQIQEFKEKFGGAKKESFPLDIRGGAVVSVDDHPNDANLYVVNVHVGKEHRQVVARLKAAYQKEQLLGKQVVLLCNLPVAELKGVKSEGMLLVSEMKKSGTQVLLQPDSKAPVSEWPGKQLVAEGTVLEVKKDIPLKEFQKLDFRINKEFKVVYKQKHVLTTGDMKDAIAVTAPGVDLNAKIK